RLLRLCILALSVITVAEITAAVGIRVLNTRFSEPIRTTNEIFREQTTLIRELLDSRIEQLHEIHPVLGWRYAAIYRKGLNRLNAAGLRSDHEYQKTPPSGLLRIAAFGDSFVYGSEVDGKEAWPAVLEQNRRIEVLNYGVPGYGTDQAY